MFSEVKCSYIESFDNFDELVKPDEWHLAKSSEDKDEFVVKPQKPNPLEDWEIRLFRAKKFIFSMSACLNYGQFVNVLESTLKRISGYLTPADIVTR